MKYESLLLSAGGGIINDAQKSEQYRGSAAVAIGIGGTGVAALSELKAKIYQQLIPDNPGEAIPRYDGIQLLAIDSDNSCMQDAKEKDKDKSAPKRKHHPIRQDEFFSIHNKTLSQELAQKGEIKKDPQLYWMDIDHIADLMSPEGAGGIRQVGRYLLMRKASALFEEIRKKCRTALEARNTGTLDIYIFAGISGGTGSGCFLDVCYLVRRLIESQGWNAKIMGYFFLPDVVTSKPTVAANKTAVDYNNCNGYAAMKELDYLMNLAMADDWFDQNYGPSLRVRTQAAPVDMCHLISASKANGDHIPNGFEYCINVAADYVMSYLANVELADQGADNGMTMRGHLSNVSRGVDGLAKKFGTNRSYHILGASNAEIPMTQINTYLTAGFFRRFNQALATKKHIAAPENAVKDLMAELSITADDVFNMIVHDTPTLDMCDIDRGTLRNIGICPRGKLPDAWVTYGDSWFSRASGNMQANYVGLTTPLSDYSFENASEDSLIGKLFRKLYEMAMDPNYGPYYAAEILCNGSYDLQAALEGQIRYAEEQKNTQIFHHGNMDDDCTQISERFVHRPNNKNYIQYKDFACRWYIMKNSVHQCMVTAKTLRNFLAQVRALYEGFFRPLCQLLDDLTETFIANDQFLAIPKTAENSTYTWQILTLNDIKKILDERIESLTVMQLIDRFLQMLLENPDEWREHNQDKVALLIRKHMLDLFKEESNKSLQDYLFDKYGVERANIQELVNKVQVNIMDEVYRHAVPMFWCDSGFSLDGGNVFENSSISVPSVAAAVCKAADNFASNHKQFYVRKTGLGDRIFALRFCSGVPLFAYQGISLLKNCYDSAATTSAGVGSHLYSYTGRGQDGSGKKGWREFLPTPMPYSKRPDLVDGGAEKLELYEAGEACGAIGTTENTNDYAIFISAPFEPKIYTLADFTVDGVFMQSAFDAEKARIQGIKDHMYDEANCKLFILKNDGAHDQGEEIVRGVRTDYFINYPLQQAMVREELKKVKAIDEALASLDAVRAEHSHHTDLMDNFCHLVFYRQLSCTNSLNEEDYNKIAFIFFDYVDKFGETKQYYLSTKANKEMTFAAKFPLYQAFLTYSAMDPKKSLRKDLDAEIPGLLGRIKKLEDAVVAARLEQIWNGDAIEELREEDTKGLSDADASSVIRFYEGLRDRILAMHDEFPVWPTKDQLNGNAQIQTQTQTETQVPPPPTSRWVYYNNEYLTLYPDQSLSYAWNSNSNNWVQLTPYMYILNAQNQWEPIKLDGSGNVIL